MKRKTKRGPTRSQLRYLNFLRMREVHPYLTFREFLTHPYFAKARG